MNIIIEPGETIGPLLTESHPGCGRVPIEDRSPTLPRRGNRNLPDIYDFVEPGARLTPSQEEDQRAWIRYDEERARNVERE